MINPVLRALRPQPHRGDQIAAGVVVLATLVLLLDVRFAGAWSDAVRLLVAAAATAFVGILAVLSPLEGERPRPYQTVLYVTTCLLLLLALGLLSLVLGAEEQTNAGAAAWTALVVALVALAFARRRNAPYCTLVAAVGVTVALVAGADLVVSPSGPTLARWMLLLALLADLFGVALLRDRQRRHAVMLVDTAGVTALALAATQANAVAVVGLGVTEAVPSWGWLLVILAVGFALVAYAGVDREPGPGYLGVAILVAFALLAGHTGEATLLGWPLVLALVALAFLVLGLRPSRPLPPAPEDAEPPEPRAVPLPRRDDPPLGPPVTRPRGDDEL